MLIQIPIRVGGPPRGRSDTVTRNLCSLAPVTRHLVAQEAAGGIEGGLSGADASQLLATASITGTSSTVLVVHDVEYWRRGVGLVVKIKYGIKVRCKVPSRAVILLIIELFGGYAFIILGTFMGALYLLHGGRLLAVAAVRRIWSKTC